MTALLILLYLADLTDKVVHIAGIASILLSIIALLVTVVLICMNSEYDELVEEKESYNLLKALRKFCLIVFFIALFLYTVTPSQKTIYLMAGVYAGDSALKTETGKKVVEMVNTQLDTIISEASKTVEKAKEIAK